MATYVNKFDVYQVIGLYQKIITIYLNDIQI